MAGGFVTVIRREDVVIAKFECIGARLGGGSKGCCRGAIMHPAHVEPYEDTIPLSWKRPLEKETKLRWDGVGWFDVEEGACESEAARGCGWT